MTTADDKVTPFPTTVERLANKLKSLLNREGVNRSDWIEIQIGKCQTVFNLREQFPADTEFGHWWNASEFASAINHQTRAAMIEMAREPDALRKCLGETLRNSLELIYRKEFDRFTSVRKPEDPKPTKPKRGRPSGNRAQSHKPRPPEHHAAAAKALDEGKTREQVAAETGLSQHQVQLSREREIGRREMLAELLDAAGAKHFTEKGALRIEDAIRINTARLDKQFAQRLGEEVRKGIAAANDAMRTNYARLSADNLYLTRIVGQRGTFTETQYRQMLMLCHPDSSASAKLKAELLQVLIENKSRLIKPERG